MYNSEIRNYVVTAAGYFCCSLHRQQVLAFKMFVSYELICKLLECYTPIHYYRSLVSKCRALLSVPSLLRYRHSLLFESMHGFGLLPGVCPLLSTVFTIDLLIY